MRYYDTGEQSQIVNYDANGRSDGQMVYIGFADSGVADTDEKWLIHYFTFTADPGTVLTRKLAIGSWENRASLVYK